MTEFPTVTAPIAHWAAHDARRLAVSDGARQLSFAELDQATRRASGPALGWVRPGRQIDRLVEFCAIVRSGRAAAVADPDWPAATLAQVQTGLIAADDAFYVGFTSGSTGLPKAYSRNYRSWTESLRACVDAFGPIGPVVAPGSLSHSLFLFAMLLGLWTGGGAHVQDRFAAPACLDVLAALADACLVAVPSQLMLLLAAGERRGQTWPGVRLILIGGARWARAETPRLRALFPAARIVEFYGASETSFIAWTDSAPGLPDTLVGRPFEGVDVAIRGPAGEPGLIFVRSPMLFTGYLLGDDGGLLRDGAWISVRDMGFLDAAGALHLVGRQRRMLLCQGRNVFPEEVEAVLEQCPGIAAASVLGTPDAVRGVRLVGLLHPLRGLDLDAVAGCCRAQLPPHKVPRRLVVPPHWPRTASGKTDHAALAAWFRDG